MIRRLRPLLLAVAAALPLAAPAPVRAQEAVPAPGDSGGIRGTAWAALPDSVRTTLARLRERGELGEVNESAMVVAGPARVATGDTIRGGLLVRGGSLEVEGVVLGPVAVVGGDLLMTERALIDGSASAIGGTVRAGGGRVTGEIRSSSGDAAGRGFLDSLDPASVEVVSGTPAERTWRAVKLVSASFAIFLVLGVGVLVFSQPTFDAVLGAMRERFARSFWTGLLAQFAILPLLLVLVIALAISLIGILLIPFAVVAYVIAVAGLLALGFLAAARMTGALFARGRVASVRSADLRGLLAGLTLYFGLGLLAASMTWHPLAATVLRAVAVAAAWAAMTVGLGAIILTGREARRARAEAHLPRAQNDPMAWQTPTPITGVVAARRPLSAAREG